VSNFDTSKGNVYLTYHPAADRIVNVAYRYLRDQQNQLDLSSQWPIYDRWTLFGRWNYSTLDSETLQAYAGFAYRRCCWALRAAATHRILGNGVPDSGFLFEFEMTGLSKSTSTSSENPIALGAFPFN
jgi:LPS-assembly protein